jgi:transcriptional regulator with GAF, ATPase, and Fis domain
MPTLREDSAGAVTTEDPGEAVLTDKQIKELQKANLIKALKQTKWRVSGAGGAAELLGVRPTTLADRIRSYGIKRPAS